MEKQMMFTIGWSSPSLPIPKAKFQLMHVVSYHCRQRGGEKDQQEFGLFRLKITPHQIWSSWRWPHFEGRVPVRSAVDFESKNLIPTWEKGKKEEEKKDEKERRRKERRSQKRSQKKDQEERATNISSKEVSSAHSDGRVPEKLLSLRSLK